MTTNVSRVESTIRTLLLMAFSLPLPAAYVASPDGTLVYDTVNNVTWLADANLAASIPFTVPVCSTPAVQPCVNASGSMSYQAAAAWVVAMNAANYLGHNNWQLPTNPPIDKNCGKVGPNGNSFGFGCTASGLATLYNGLGFKAPNTAVPIPANTVVPFSNFQPYIYWSQTSQGGQGYSTFSFANGFHGANTGPNFLYSLPMIPGKIPGTPPATGNSLQINPGGQTVYDPVSNVTWLANANLAASNAFGLPACQNPTTPTLCIAADGAMTWDSANQWIANMNTAAYLGQNNWQLPPIDPTCSGFNCTTGTKSPMGELFYGQLGLKQGTPVVTAPNLTTGSFHNVQPYLYWGCLAATIQDPCETTQPVFNQEWSFTFGSGFEGTDLVTNELYATAYFVGAPGSNSGPVPVLTDGSVANGATYIGGGLVPGSWAQVKGTNLANVTHLFTQADLNGNNMPLTMNGTSVTVDGIPAALYYISSTQINFQVPAGVAGTVAVQVTNNGAASNLVSASTAASAAGIWPNPGNFAAAVFASDGKLAGDPALYSGYRAAKPGEQVELFGTGLAASPAGVWIDTFEEPLSGVTVTLGTITVPAEGAGLRYPGEFQINFQVPAEFANMPAANYPLTVSINGVSSPGTVNSGPLVIPVQP